MTEWLPKVDIPADGWPGGVCPIPDAKAGEYRIWCATTPFNADASEWHWGSEAEAWNITAYALRAPVDTTPADIADTLAEALQVILDKAGSHTVSRHAMDQGVNDPGFAGICAVARSALAAYRATKEGSAS